MHISMNDMRHKVGMPLCMYSTFELLSWCRCHHRFHWILCMCNGQWNNIIVMIIIFMLLRQSNHTHTITHTERVEHLNCSFYLNKHYIFSTCTHTLSSSFKCNFFVLKMWHLWIDFDVWLCSVRTYAIESHKTFDQNCYCCCCYHTLSLKIYSSCKVLLHSDNMGRTHNNRVCQRSKYPKRKVEKNEPTNQQNGYIHRVWWSGNVCALLGTTHTNSFGDNVYSIKCDEWFIRRYDSAASHSHIYIKFVCPGAIYSCIFRSILSLTLARARSLAGFCLCVFVYLLKWILILRFFDMFPPFLLALFLLFRLYASRCSHSFSLLFSLFSFLFCVLCFVYVSFCVLWFLVLLLHVKLLFIVVINFFSSFLLLNWVCECEYDTAIRLSYRAKVIWWYFFGCFCISAPKVWQP